jgi:hypothetical protein
MKKTAARDTWREIEPGLSHIARILSEAVAIPSSSPTAAVRHAPAAG